MSIEISTWLCYGVKTSEGFEEIISAKGLSGIPYGNTHSSEPTQMIAAIPESITMVADKSNPDLFGATDVPLVIPAAWNKLLGKHYPDKTPRWWVCTWVS
jgi:hypothetical protein